jgi:hypothetical protein
MPPRPSLPLAGLVAGLTLVPSLASGAEFSGSTTTILRGFDVIEPEYEGEPPTSTRQRVRTYRTLDQYVRLSWDGLGPRKAWEIDLDLRGREDLSTGEAEDPATGRHVGQEDLGVLLAMARWRSEHDHVHVSLGRQRAVTGLRWHSFDGVRLDFPKLQRANFYLIAGLPVDIASYDRIWAEGETYGAGFALAFPQAGSIAFDYERRDIDKIEKVLTTSGTEEWLDSIEETLGADLGLSWAGFTLQGNADYSLVEDRFGETTALVRQAFARRHVAELRFTRVDPVFATNTIWAVFETNPYDEWRASYEWRADGGWRHGFFAADEDYEDTDLAGPDDMQRAAATFAYSGRWNSEHRGELGWQDGFSGSRAAARYDVDANVAPRWRVGGGASANRYENFARLTERDEAFALRARVHHDHDGRWDVGLELEQYFGRDRDTLRATLVFATKLGAARRGRPWWGGRWGEAWDVGAAPRRGEAVAEEAR